jgi:hypothetical protein
MAGWSFLHGEKTAEERPVAAKGEAQILGRYIVTTIPLVLELCSFRCKPFREALHRHRDEIISLLHGAARIVDETYLDRIPAGSKFLCFLGRKERRCLLLPSWSGRGAGGGIAARCKAGSSGD